MDGEEEVLADVLERPVVEAEEGRHAFRRLELPFDRREDEGGDAETDPEPRKDAEKAVPHVAGAGLHPVAATGDEVPREDEEPDDREVAEAGLAHGPVRD